MSLPPLPPHAPEVLLQGAKILSKAGCKWWVSAGTLLGIHRDGRLIPHDTDLDVGIAIQTVGQRNAIERAFTERGWPLYAVTPYQRAFLYRETIFDIYFFTLDGGDLVCDMGSDGVMRKPASLFHPMGTVAFHHSSPVHAMYVELPAPNDIDRYLEIRYGPNWRIPTTDKRDWHDDAANLERP